MVPSHLVFVITTEPLGFVLTKQVNDFLLRVRAMTMSHEPWAMSHDHEPFFLATLSKWLNRMSAFGFPHEISYWGIMMSLLFISPENVKIQFYFHQHEYYIDLENLHLLHGRINLISCSYLWWCHLFLHYLKGIIFSHSSPPLPTTPLHYSIGFKDICYSSDVT